MSGAWTCSRNHRWSLPADAATLDGPPACPECGDPGGQVDAAETLPPADEPIPVPALADVHVPGYELLAELGRGAMGVVYRAREVKLGRPVALKMILSGGHASPGDRARFKREAEAVAALRHSNIVQIYAVGESGGLPFCALEYIEGGNLADHTGGKPLPPERAAELVEHLARAVHFAHEHNIVHRDLKPANVLLTEDGTPKIADFGLAKKIDSATGPTATGAILGTPAYMAPEQAGGNGKTVGPAADTYALGAIFYELLTGRPPFKAATPLDTILQVVSTEPVPPRAVNPKVPRDLETVTLKCLRKEPAKRYASAADLAEDLRRWRAGEPVTARPLSRRERLWRGVRRRRGWLIAVSAATLTLFFTRAVWPPRAPQDRWLKMVPATPSSVPIEPPGPRAITATTLDQAKEAVVAVRSTRGEGTLVGSGFLAVEPGIVVTTLSVLGMDHPLTPAPDRIEVTLLPGAKESHKTQARLLSVDRTESLACLQISAIGLPPPFALAPSSVVRESARVYVAGIPVSASGIESAKIEPAMKVRPVVMTGRILSREGSVKYLQFEGGAESQGAALIAADGRLVGIMLAGIAASNMRFAAPAESVGWVLRERVQSLRLGQAVVAGKGSQLPITARVADPLNRLWKLSLDVCTGDADWTPRSPDGKPKGLIGEFGRHTFSLTPSPNDRAGPGEERDFVGEIDLPPLPAGKVYWVQPQFRVSRGGQVGGSFTIGDAVMLPDAGPPVERVPVRLALNPAAWPTAERRLDLNVVREMSVEIGDRGDAHEERDYAATVAERSVAGDGPSAAKLKWRFGSYRFNDGNTQAMLPKQLKSYFAGLAKTTAEIDLSPDGKFAAVRPDLSKVEEKIRPQVQALTTELTETLRALNPALAARNLEPGESWPTEAPFAYPIGRATAQAVNHLTSTYVGVRDRGGRREAIIEFTGDSAPAAGQTAGSAAGRTTGAFAVDVQTGQVVLARVATDMILEMGVPGAGAGGQPAKTKVGMVLEMRFQRGPIDGPPIPAVMPLPNGRIDFRPFVPLPGS